MYRAFICLIKSNSNSMLCFIFLLQTLKLLLTNNFTISTSFWTALLNTDDRDVVNDLDNYCIKYGLLKTYWTSWINIKCDINTYKKSNLEFINIHSPNH